MSVVLRRWWAAHRSPDSRLARRLTAAATVLFLLILCATIAAYFPALQGDFLWDDAGHVTRPDLQSWAGLLRI